MHLNGEVYENIPAIIVKEKKVWCFVKTDNISFGSAGVITYEIDGLLGKKLQLMRYIPFVTNFCFNFFGVCVGDDSASDQLFEKMLNGKIEDGLKRDVSCDPNNNAAELTYFDFQSGMKI